MHVRRRREPPTEPTLGERGCARPRIARHDHQPTTAQPNPEPLEPPRPLARTWRSTLRFQCFLSWCVEEVLLTTAVRRGVGFSANTSMSLTSETFFVDMAYRWAVLRGSMEHTRAHRGTRGGHEATDERHSTEKRPQRRRTIGVTTQIFCYPGTPADCSGGVVSNRIMG